MHALQPQSRECELGQSDNLSPSSEENVRKAEDQAGKINNWDFSDGGGRVDMASSGCHLPAWCSVLIIF